MAWARLAVATLGGLTIVGCFEPEGAEANSWEGQRVVVTTELVDEVCVGTLTWLDALVESIEAELELDDSEEKIEIIVLESEEIQERCGVGTGGCANKDRVYVSSGSLSRVGRHELAHARLLADGIWGTSLFAEGIASALSVDGNCLASDKCATSDLDDLLAVTTSLDLLPFDGYTAGADLVHGMLTTYGPAAVLAFIAELPSDAPPEDVRAAYLEHFGTTLDSDFEAFKRGPHDDYTVAQRECDGLIPAARGADGSVEVRSTMECSSPEVVNRFRDPSGGMISWTFTVTPEQSGAFRVTRAPADADVTLVGCRPPRYQWGDFADGGAHYSWSWTSSFDTDSVILAAGQYRIEWIDDFGDSLDFELTPPCVFESGGCAAGEQCTIWNECEPEVAEPAGLGEACEQLADGPLACEAGSRCVAGTCIAECDATQECGEGLGCSRTRVCGSICELLTQDCEPGFACLPSSDVELTESGVGVCLPAGAGEMFASCDARASECQAGLSCEYVLFNSPCTDSKSCCVPYCDASAAESGCPSALSVCDSISGAAIGVCQPQGATPPDE